MHVMGQPIQLGHHHRRLALAGRGEHRGELGPRSKAEAFLACLDFQILCRAVAGDDGEERVA
jgi:hypothetical protein